MCCNCMTYCKAASHCLCAGMLMVSVYRKTVNTILYKECLTNQHGPQSSLVEGDQVQTLISGLILYLKLLILTLCSFYIRYWKNYGYSFIYS